MKILSYIAISLAGLLAGAVVGGLGGLLLGWFLALGYHKHGPSDPGDAPVYVALSLMLVGACLGAIAGVFVGIIYSVRLAHPKGGSHELVRQDKPDEMRRPVSRGMRYAPNVRRAQGTKKETGNAED